MRFTEDLKKRLIEEGFDTHFVKHIMDDFEDIPSQEFSNLSFNQLDDFVEEVINRLNEDIAELFEVDLEDKMKIVESIQLHQEESIRAIDESDKSTKPQVMPKPESKLLLFKVQLIEADRKDEKPLSRFKVTVSLLGEEIVKTITGKNGNFSFHYLAEKGKKTGKYEFKLVVSDSQDNEVHTKTISVEPTVEKYLVVKVPMSEYRRKIAVPIEDITDKLGYKLPSGLFSFMKKNNIKTLEDIRKNKGIKHFKDLPINDDHPDVIRLEGHAYLHTLSKDISLNGFLIEKGYVSPSAVGGSSLTQFIKNTKSKLNKEEAERLWRGARKQNLALDLMASSNRIEMRKRAGMPKGGAEPELSDEPKEPCVCEECNSAVSPRAYLVQLLSYVVENLDITDRRNETQKDIFDWLSETFCIHFDKFSSSCEAMDEEVLQIRLCIEVLQYYLDNTADFEETQKAYCIKAYETLLTQIGTSRDELRLMRGVGTNADDQLQDELDALEKRLGFRLNIENENRIEQLYLHRGADIDEIAEDKLDELFGLPQTDPEAEPSNALPLVVVWRKEYLKEQWGREDRKESETAWDRPIVDPDLIGLDDLRLPNNNTFAFDLWKKRREWIDERINKLAAKSPNILEMFVDIMTMPIAYDGGTIGYIEHSTWHEGDRILDDRRWLEEWIELKGNLSEESFERLMEIWKKDHTQLSSEEIEELITILIQSQKSRLEQTWKDEEGDLLLGSAHFWLPLTEPSLGEWPPIDHDSRPLIDPDFIEKIDLRDTFGLTMKNGKTFIETWDERQTVLRNIQFDLLLEQENIAGMIYFALKRDIPNVSDPLLEIDNFSSKIIEVSEKMDNLYSMLKQATDAANSSDIEAAENAIESEYSSLLTIEEFKTLTELKQKVGTINRLTTDQWIQAVSIIKSAFKKRAGWKSEEKKDDHTSFEYWEILKTKLPKWRADTGTRQKWQTALEANSSVPIIEPDIIFSGDITDSILLEKRENRITEIDGIATDLGNPSASSDAEQLAWFKSTLIDKIGFHPDEFDTLAARYDSGQTVVLRLQQISLPINAFLRLNKLYTLLESGQALYDNEVGEVKAVLSSVLKRRLYPEWCKDEDNIILDPDKFSLNGAIPKEKPEEWYKWQFDHKARKRWLQTLEARSAQLDAIDDGLQNAVKAAEEAALPILRSGLIDTAYDKHSSDRAGDDVEELEKNRARWVTNYFLIDAETETCRKTTRLQQAIETLQMILWSSRTGLLQDTHPEISINLVADDFDEDWKWIGSYATWRAPMFMFLYPENILLPTLRKWEKQTPEFKKLVENVRAEPLLGSKKVRELAKAYSDYYHDVCNLTIEATCEVKGFAFTMEEHLTTEETSNSTNLLFIFGRVQDRVYFSISSCANENDTRQTFWRKVPGMETNIKQVFETAIFNVHNEHTYLYIFAEKLENGKSELVFSRYNLEINEWDGGESHILETRFEGVSNCLINQFGNSPLTFLIKGQEILSPIEGRTSLTLNYSSVIAQLSSDGLYLKEEDVVPVQGIEDPCGFHILSDSRVMIFQKGRSGISARQYSKQSLEYMNGSGEWVYFEEQYWKTLTGSHTYIFATIEEPDWFFSFAVPNSEDRYMVVFGYGSIAWFIEIRPNLSNNSIDMSLPYRYMLRLDSVGTPRFAGEEQIIISGNQLPRPEKNYNQTYKVYIPLINVPREDIRVLGVPQWYRIAPQIANTLSGENSDSYSIDMFLITDQFSTSQLQQRKIAMLREFDRNSFDENNINITYLKEAYYFIPILLAHSLNQNSEYQAALDWYRTVYDFVSDETERVIYAGLTLESTTATDYTLANNWIDDPLDIHETASTRGYSYTRFTLQTIIRCLLDYADAEFTFDTSESIARARDLYLQALLLLDASEFQQPKNECDGVIAELELSVGTQIEDSEEFALWISILEDLKKINELDLLRKTIKAINKIMDEDEVLLERIEEARQVIDNALDEQDNLSNSSILDLMRRGELDKEIKRKDLLSDSSIGNDVALLSSQDDSIKSGFIGISNHFCILPNPIPCGLRLHAELNLYKIRTCRNIAGMKREIEPYAAPTDATSAMPFSAGGQLQLPGTVTIPPTQYRYAVLIERTKQLLSLAQQMESTFLSTLEKYDAETYSQLKARQDASLARTGIKLQELRVTEAEHGVILAVLQKERAEIQKEHFADLIDNGLLWTEQWAVNLLMLNAGLQFLVGAITTGGAIVAGATVGGVSGSPTGPGAFFTALASGASGAALSMSLSQTAYSSITGGISTTSSVFSMMASFERREQEWEFQKQLASHDINIGNQQITLANDRKGIVGQEYNIAKMQSEFSDDAVAFLNNKFTNTELYDWMSGVLEGAFRYFLQQATAMAKLSENQLAFERQEVPPAYIQNDYWEAPAEGAVITSGEDSAVDRRGLTGSSRLLVDIYKLDQHAFETDKRKLQLTKTISLVQLDPFAFQRFVQTGVMVFETSMRMFDQDFPGHYLRLIKRMRTSVLALIPPTEGIKATLQSSGVSRVVVRGDTFQKTTIRRDPESVALSSPQNATGLFELQQESRMMLPFESSGVDMVWEFRMPKASNPFDFKTIADVLVTIEYTALDSYDYRQQVIKDLDRSVSADRAFSFRYQFPDHWYALNNPDQNQTPLEVTFEIRRGDFPPNIQDLAIQQILVFFATKDGKMLDEEITLELINQGNGVTYGGSATQIENVISTRSGSAAGWSSLIGKIPIGYWKLKLTDSQKIRNLFKNNEIEDILFIITYMGETPAWPE